MRRLCHTMISTLLIILTTGFFTEWFLFRQLDPWGAFAYYADMATLRQEYIPTQDGRGYTLPVETLALRGWTATITNTGRLVPASGHEGLIVALVGDSYTFGHGVIDSDTFANRLAEMLPTVTVQNWGMNGYNTAQVLATVEHVQADRYVYLVIGNDTEPVVEMTKPEPMALWQGLKVYHYYWLQDRRVQAAEPLTPPEWFMQDMDTLARRGDVLIVGFEHDALGQYVAAHYPQTVLIPAPGHRISKADGHPNTEGHRNIARSILPYLLDILS